MEMRAGLIILIFFCYLLFTGAAITASVLFVKNLMDLLREVDPKNRLVAPGFVWMLFIPFYGAFIYPFTLYPRIAESLKREFESRDHPQPGDYGKSLGTALPIISIGLMIPFVNFVVVFGFAVVGIIFWVKMARYKRLLRSLPRSGRMRFSSKTDLLD